ncbi:unnamed protein product [Calicophoron daubneyi]|uniref:Uncharacterized protein n=1 Tax=Calicophoron daubneyi TaxID=300641 RepID=A0AAV2TCH0_CALDB
MEGGETLGLESSQRTQLLKQIQSNMSSILFSQIKREPVAKVNGELTVSSSQQNPDFKASQSLRSSLQSTGSNPLRETFASEDQADQLSSASNDDQQVTSSFTDVHQKRRQELQRINQKMYSSATVVGSPQAVAVPNYSIALNRQPDTCWSSPFVRTQSVRMDYSLGIFMGATTNSCMISFLRTAQLEEDASYLEEMPEACSECGIVDMDGYPLPEAGLLKDTPYLT